MKSISNKIKILTGLFVVTAILITVQSCQKALLRPNNNIQLLPKLSAYNIFDGEPSDLIPAEGFCLYEIPTQLFADYAEKQRLIKIPVGTKIAPFNNGLPRFPEGTILVKTFYFFNDKRDTSKGKKIIETRLLIKSGATWNVGTYHWNNEQTEADLVNSGFNETVDCIDESGNRRIIKFHIPNINECATCHSSNGDITPIGTKMRNWNIDVARNNTIINQLTYFENSGILNPVDPASFSSLPNWLNTNFSIEQRARAYLDINCAHCHNPGGYAGKTHIYFSYETSFHETRIGKVKNGITNEMSSGRMPKLGTTVVDEKGLALIKEYIRTL